MSESRFYKLLGFNFKPEWLGAVFSNCQNFLTFWLFPWRLRFLIWQFARRDILARYRSSWLGLAWAFLTPLLMLGVYTFVFHGIFGARWAGGSERPWEFSLQLYTGLIVFGLWAEMLSRSPNLIVEQSNLVKKAVFPLEILPWSALLVALFHSAMNLLVLLIAVLITHGTLSVSLLAAPLILGACIPFLLGISWFLSALGVFVRDVGQIMGTITNVLLFLSPVFYPASALPEPWRPWLALNPLTVIIEQTRRVVLEGLWPDWEALGGYFAASCLVALLGAAWFQLTRKGFADVL